MKIEEKKNSWIFIVPIFGLELTDQINNEIRICKVTFISRDKLIRVRKKFGIPQRISSYPRIDFFNEKVDTYAVIRQTGKITDITEKLYKLLDDELNILISSFSAFKDRNFFHKIGYFGDSKYSTFSYIFLSSDEPTALYSSQSQNLMPLRTDNWWHKHQKKHHYYDLISILNNRKHKWNKLLCKISILRGKSFNSNDTVDAFLYNMIILETLLTTANDKQKDALMERLRAFFGWLCDWNKDTDNRILSLYKKRNSYVHSADIDEINIEDLLFTDELIINLLINILKHPKLFSNKDDLIDFSKKVEAEKLLNIKPKIHPKTFCYSKRVNPKVKKL